jgi:ribokinase
MQERILVVGSADMDLTMNMHLLPRAGEIAVEDNRFDYTAGGAGTIAALSLIDLGAAPMLAARVGGDSHGTALTRLFEGAGIDPQCIAIDSRAATGLRVTMQEDSGNSRILYYPGANRNLRLSDVERVLGAARPEALYVSCESPAETVIGTIRAASARGIPVFLDGGGMDPDFPLHGISGLDFFCADDKDIYALTGTFPAGTDSCLKAAVALEKRLRARYFIIKLGDRGLFLYDGKYCHMVPGYGIRLPEGASLSESVSPAILLEYLRSRDLLAACRFGMALCALLVKNEGDPNYFPTIEEIRDFAERH